MFKILTIFSITFICYKPMWWMLLQIKTFFSVIKFPLVLLYIFLFSAETTYLSIYYKHFLLQLYIITKAALKSLSSNYNMWFILNLAMLLSFPLRMHCDILALFMLRNFGFILDIVNVRLWTVDSVILLWKILFLFQQTVTFLRLQ